MHEKEIEFITVFVGRWQREYFADWAPFRNKKVNLVEIDIPNRSISRNLWHLYSLPKIAKKFGADIVHLTFPVPVIRDQFQCAVVVSLHDFYPYDRPDNFGFPAVYFNRAFLRYCLRKVDFSFCVSEETVARLNAWIPRVYHRRSMMIHNCADPAKEHNHAIHSVLTVNPPFFLMVAQHRANKNIGFALDVFSELLRRLLVDVRMQLAIVGNHGPETIRLRKRVEDSDLKTKVRWMDKVSDDELFGLYSSCEALLVPSLMEGFCLPVIEALRCGSRVVCSDIPVLREIGGDACHYFDLRADSPMEAMIAAVHAALREERPEAAVALERFSIESVAAKYMSVYRRLVIASR